MAGGNLAVLPIALFEQHLSIGIADYGHEVQGGGALGQFGDAHAVVSSQLPWDPLFANGEAFLDGRAEMRGSCGRAGRESGARFAVGATAIYSASLVLAGG